MLPFVFDDGFGFDRYAEHALDVPMYFVIRNKQYINVAGESFRAFMRGELPQLPGEKPTVKDWEDHLSTLFPEVRLKQFLEMRGADMGDRAHVLALPALWVGLLYDEDALDEPPGSWSRTGPARRCWTLRNDVPRTAIHTPFRGCLVSDIAREIVELAKRGLKRRGLGEEQYLAPLERDAGARQDPGRALARQISRRVGRRPDADLRRSRDVAALSPVSAGEAYRLATSSAPPASARRASAPSTTSITASSSADPHDRVGEVAAEHRPQRLDDVLERVEVRDDLQPVRREFIGSRMPDSSRIGSASVLTSGASASSLLVAMPMALEMNENAAPSSATSTSADQQRRRPARAGRAANAAPTSTMPCTHDHHHVAQRPAGDDRRRAPPASPAAGRSRPSAIRR